MYGWGRVIAVEPQEPIYWALAGNLAINNCFNATAIHAAVGSECGEILIPSLDYSRPSSFGSLELRPGPRTEFIGQPVDYSPSGGRSVKLLSIDSLCLDRIDFIKVDVEGMELEVLAGAAHSIGRFRPIMLAETIKVDGSELLGLLENAGYRTVNVGRMNLLAVHRDDPCCEHIRTQWGEGGKQ
jgi:FkbM family methyltransferase